MALPTRDDFKNAFSKQEDAARLTDIMKTLQTLSEKHGTANLAAAFDPCALKDIWTITQQVKGVIASEPKKDAGDWASTRGSPSSVWAAGQHAVFESDSGSSSSNEDHSPTEVPPRARKSAAEQTKIKDRFANGMKFVEGLVDGQSSITDDAAYSTSAAAELVLL